MKKRTETTKIKGGSVKRDAATGRFMEVRTGAGVARAAKTSDAAVGEASSRRRAALKRLADR